MLAGALLVSLFVTSDAPVAGRYEMGVRLQNLEKTWLATANIERRQAAVSKISAAVAGFFSGQFGSVCKALDEADCDLRERDFSEELAINLRPEKAIYEPGEAVRIKATWAYRVGESRELSVTRSERVLAKVKNGVNTEFEIDSSTEEGDYEIALNVGRIERLVKFSKIKNLESRLEALSKSDDPVIVGAVAVLRSAINRPDRLETDLRAHAVLEQIESIAAGKESLEADGRHLFPVFNSIPMRVAIPASVIKQPGERKAIVIVALHGAGGSENLFFEAYGNGLAVQESLKRGWVFISPRATPTAIENSLEFLKKRFAIVPERLFVMGHSMGGGLALQSARHAPDGLALFAPAGAQIPEPLRKTPIFLAVGKQEMPPLLASARRMAEQIAGESRSKYVEYEHCEHMMIVADALPAALAFFDGLVGHNRTLVAGHCPSVAFCPTS